MEIRCSVDFEKGSLILKEALLTSNGGGWGQEGWRVNYYENTHNNRKRSHIWLLKDRYKILINLND